MNSTFGTAADGASPLDENPVTDAPEPSRPVDAEKAKAEVEADPAAQPDPDHFDQPPHGGSFERLPDGTLKLIETTINPGTNPGGEQEA